MTAITSCGRPPDFGSKVDNLKLHGHSAYKESKLTTSESDVLANSLWTWEFRPSKLRIRWGRGPEIPDFYFADWPWSARRLRGGAERPLQMPRGTRPRDARARRAVTPVPGARQEPEMGGDRTKHFQ